MLDENQLKDKIKEQAVKDNFEKVCYYFVKLYTLYEKQGKKR